MKRIQRFFHILPLLVLFLLVSLHPVLAAGRLFIATDNEEFGNTFPPDRLAVVPTNGATPTSAPVIIYRKWAKLPFTVFLEARCTKHGQGFLYLSGEVSRLVEPLTRLD